MRIRSGLTASLLPNCCTSTSRESDSLNFQSLNASELDELYHKRTDFDVLGYC
jgi:hypothetical protein